MVRIKNGRSVIHKSTPVLFYKKEECCGCNACFVSCSKSAINMVADNEGFNYPFIDADSCISCNNCVLSCSFRTDQNDNQKIEIGKKEPAVYAVKHIDDSIRMKSRSGGVFTALSDYFLEADGIVYGCILDEELKVIHARADNKDERDKMRCSKYVQSDLGNSFKKIKEDLDNKKPVIFSGTSCQVSGLNQYLRAGYENLLCVDIVCHGVPSPKLWQDYVKWQEKKNKGKIVRAEFRNKKDFGWKEHKETLHFDNGRKIDSNVYASLFYNLSFLRPSCYHCPYKSIYHPSDITIADYWGIEKILPEFDDNLGVSLVLVNTTKGTETFEKIKNSIIYRKTRIEDSMQKPLESPYDAPINRNEVWSDYNRLKFEKFIKKYAGYGILNNIKNKIRYYKSLIHRM